MSQALIADLFQTTPQNITLHLKSIYADGELDPSQTCKDYLQVRPEGTRQVQRVVKYLSGRRLRSQSYRQVRLSVPREQPDRVRRG
jgi:hypothetical protein